jgi:hypothetical protein
MLRRRRRVWRAEGRNEGAAAERERDEQFRVCPREREREGMALPSRHVPSVADTAHGPPAIIRAALRPGPPSCAVQHGERARAAGVPHGPARAWRVLPCALRNETVNAMGRGAGCELRVRVRVTKRAKSANQRPARHARLTGIWRSVWPAPVTLHPVLTPGAPFTRSFLAACSWNAALLLLGGEEKKSQQEMSVLLKLPPHMASPSHNVQWSTPSTCSNHDDAAGLDST